MSPTRVRGGWYAALLRLLPADFRARHGAEMQAVFEEMRARTRGVGPRLRFHVGAVLDVLELAWRQRASVRRRKLDQRKRERGGGWMETLISDLRYAVRQMLRQPGFTTVMVLTLALGIGANTAVFSVVNGVVLRPLPYPEPSRLTVVWSQFPTMDLMEFPSSWPEYMDYKGASRSYEEMGIWGRTLRTLTGGTEPERITVAYFSASMFEVLGVEAAVGRVFGEEEDLPGSDDVVVLSHGLWMRAFGGDPTVIGRTAELDGRSITVLGVMPPDFAFPDTEVQAWIPAGVDPTNPPGRSNHFARILGRLAPGVTHAQAERELQGLMERWQEDETLGHKWSARANHPAFLRPLHEDTVGDVRTALFVLLGAVGLVLLIACANVANLLMVRGEGRLRELSIRTAMGAGRGRIVSQLVTESMLMAVLGGAAGIILARLGVMALLGMAPPDLPRLDTVGIDRGVLLFAGGVALFAGLLFGVAPALQTLRMDVQGTLREEGRGGTSGRGRLRVRQLLVVGQTGVALILLIGAGLLIQSFRNLNGVEAGFRSEGVLTAAVSLTTTSYPEPSDVTGFFRDLTARVAAIPGVSHAGLVRTPPLTGSLPPNDIEFENREQADGDPPLNADIQLVSQGYFETMGIPLLHGRLFETLDHEESEAVAVVDEALATRFFGSAAAALDERIRQAGPAQEYARIVGVVGDVRHEGLDQDARAQLYLLHAQSPRTWFPVRAMTLVLRTSADPLSLTAAVREQVKAVDPNLPLYRVRTMDETVARSTATERFNMLLQLAFAAVALALAVVGIYGVLSYSVAQRTREIGIRMALGAERESILRLVVGQGMRLVGGAVLLGTLGAVAGGQVLASLLFGISPRDPATFGLVTGSVILVALAACWIPARRASSVSPQTALRHE